MKATGKTRYRLSWNKKLILQWEFEYFKYKYPSLSGKIVSVWIDAKPEWLLDAGYQGMIRGVEGPD